MLDGGYKIRDQGAMHFITFAVVEWVDVFTRKMYADVVVDSLQFCIEKKGLNVHGWCLMSNHIHLIISANIGASLSCILRDFKKFTSSKIIKAIKENYRESRRSWMLKIFRAEGYNNIRNTKYQFWRQENHPVELFSNWFIDQKLTYIHNNPVKAQIVDNPEHYIYSSARDYAGIKGKIKISFIEFLW